MPQKPGQSRPRLLFVEDDATLRTHLAAELSNEYVVDTAGDGIEALKAVMRRKPDLIVTDIVMPQMDGLELLKTLRSEPGTQGLPVLLISGRAEEAQRIEGFREGADGYLAKPYSVSELRAVVGSMLQAADHRAETARREAREVALAERAALLESLTERLRESDRRKSEFLALLAHELRNPLAPIGNGLKILRLRATSDAVVDRTVDMMERQMRHLVRLVDDLLDVGRITSGKLQLRTQQVLVADVLETAVESTRSLIETRGHQLAVEIRAPDVTVEADPDRLVQVFANLLTNSAKYTERGGSIRLVLEREDEEAVIAVADNGIGIPAQSIASVFEMFSQLGGPSSRAEGEGGLGIGLALVHRLVQMHRGAVSAASEGLGKGSTFTVRLPLGSVTSVETLVVPRATAASVQI
jgi:signal transduction histidine kinase